MGKVPKRGEAGNTGEDESLQELSDEVGNLHIREMELRAQRRELITRVARLEREMYKYNSTENSSKADWAKRALGGKSRANLKGVPEHILVETWRWCRGRKRRKYGSSR